MTTTNKNLIGQRIQLIRVTDPFTKLVSGDKGTVNFVDDMGTIFVKWDNGSSLGLNNEFGDMWVILSKETNNV